MIKTIFFSLFVIINSVSFCSAEISQPINTQISCAPEIRSCLNAIQQLPEACQLIAEVQKEGPVRFAVSRLDVAEQFGAYWDSDLRIINVLYPSPSEGETIGSIIFELHNALVSKKLTHLDYQAYTGQIGKEEYVRSVEYLEYVNSKKASAIVQKGIASGLFPKSAFLPTYRDFNEHYYYQRVSGHSGYIANNFDSIRRTAFLNRAAG